MALESIMFDMCLGYKLPQYLVFWDKNRLVRGGLWILFDNDTDNVLKILEDSVIGDIILAINKEDQPVVTYEEMYNHEPDVRYITGISIPTKAKPDNYISFILRYFNKIKQILPTLEENSYRYKVYTHLIERMDKCELLFGDGINIEETGLISL